MTVKKSSKTKNVFYIGRTKVVHPLLNHFAKDVAFKNKKSVDSALASLDSSHKYEIISF